MIATEPTEKKTVHLGRNVQRTREILGMKQLTLADITGMSQQNISKLEQSEFIPDDTLEKLAKGLGVTVEFIKNFNEAATFNIISNTFTSNDNSTLNAINYQPAITNHNNPVDKVVELFEKLLKSEQEKVELLANANKAILELSEQLKGMRK
jgi:transcriptional regulator with XRE-family HTH domain